MRIPLAPYGRMLVTLALAIGLAAAGWFLPPAPWSYAAGGLLSAFVLYLFAFARDPRRTIPTTPGLLVSPADGVVKSIAPVEHEEWLDGPALRIDIFLGLHNVHINRTPIAGQVAHKEVRPGTRLDARRPEATLGNAQVVLGIETTDPPGTRVLVRQIVGLVARRIVSAVKQGDRLDRGQRIGMMVLGSRMTVSIDTKEHAGAVGFAPDVAPGDRVRGGETVLGRFGAPAAPVDTSAAPRPESAPASTHDD